MSVCWSLGAHIAIDSPEKDHRDHEAQKDDDNDRVSETEPMDTLVENMLQQCESKSESREEG